MIPVTRQSARRWHSHKPGSRLPLLSTRPAVTFPAKEHNHPLTGTKVYCLGTKAHVCEQLAQGHYLTVPRLRVDPGTFRSPVWPITVTPSSHTLCNTICSNINTYTQMAWLNMIMAGLFCLASTFSVITPH